MKKLEKIFQKLRQKINDLFPLSIFVLITVLYVAKTFVFVPFESVSANNKTKDWYLRFLGKWEIIHLGWKNGKLRTFLIFGTGIYGYSGFSSWFIFWNQIKTNELDYMDNVG